MKIVVCVKWVGVLGDDVEFVDETPEVDPDYLDHVLNEWDACAVAEALRLRAAAGGGEVVVVTAGSKDAEEGLVQGIAMGADRAIRVETGTAELSDPLTIGRLLCRAIEPERPDLVLCGAQSSDAAQAATGGVLAALLDLPCAAVVTKIEHDGARGKIVAWCEREGGVLDSLEVATPALVTVQTGIAEPTYVTVRALQQARQSKIHLIEGAVTGEPGYRVRQLLVPPKPEAEMIGGGPSAVAARITDLVKEVQR
jgi:electron transfer flavoprotein beta subunit